MIEFSSSAQMMRSSEIRRLMKLAADPAIISFAGGMPNNSLFPVAEVDGILSSLTMAAKQAALQYTPTAGYPPLIESLKKYLAAKGLPVDRDGLIVTTGAQQALNLTAKVLIDPGDIVLTEFPSFIGAIAAFKSYGADLKSVAMDDEGIVVSELERVYESCPAKPKILYVNTHFHNPAGIIYSPERKKALLEFTGARRLCLLEDDPYGELYFDDNDADLTMPVKSMARGDELICYTGSFAKILGPGMRLGWLMGPKELVEKCELAKQSMDACSPAFSQVVANQYLQKNLLPPYLQMLRPIYARRARLMLDALQEHMPRGVVWTKPRGGFYVWVTLPELLDSTKVFDAALEKGAAFVIGNAFDPEARRNNCFRLAFSHTPEERIAEGVRIIAEAVVKLLPPKQS